MHDIHYSLYSLLTQSLKPDKILLYLVKQQFPNREQDIPKTVLNFKQNGLTIRWVSRDLKSYLQLLPALKEYLNDIIITVDDDIFYQRDLIADLIDAYKKQPHTIIANRVHLIRLNTSGKILPYNQWGWCQGTSKASLFNFATGVGGVLYPPFSLDQEVFNERSFKQLAPTSDDIWFWAMAVKNNTHTTTIESREMIYINPERELRISKETTLSSINMCQNKNDDHIKNVVAHYGLMHRLKQADSSKYDE